MVELRSLSQTDRERARSFLRERWGDEIQVANGEAMRPAEHEGFVAGDWVGLVTYRIAEDTCEVTLIDGPGIGAELMTAVRAVATARGCARIRLVTTNDNLRARRFYERLGFSVVEVRVGAVDEARRTIKPSIPVLNEETGLPIRDELELELRLDAGRSGEA